MMKECHNRLFSKWRLLQYPSLMQLLVKTDGIRELALYPAYLYNRSDKQDGSQRLFSSLFTPVSTIIFPEENQRSRATPTNRQQPLKTSGTNDKISSFRITGSCAWAVKRRSPSERFIRAGNRLTLNFLSTFCFKTKSGRKKIESWLGRKIPFQSKKGVYTIATHGGYVAGGSWLRTIFIRSLATLLLLFFLTQVPAQSRNSFANVLNLTGPISNGQFITPSAFSDMGAWHAYALPAEKESYGGFTGPLLMDMSGKWLAKDFAQLQVTTDGKTIDLSDAKYSATYFPGLLQQTLETNNLKIALQLIFVSNRQALINTKITNTGSAAKSVAIGFHGKLQNEDAGIVNDTNGLKVQFSKSKNQFYIHYMGKEKPMISVNGKEYRTTYKQVVLKKQQSIELVQEQAFYAADEQELTPDFNFSNELKKNENRWNQYLASYFTKAKGLSPDKKRLAVKSIITLMTNWRSAFKDILHDGVFPSISYQGFYGVWSWDSWKQAVGLASFNPALAQENIRSMFDYQDQYGMVADCIYADKSENNWRDTKAPLAAWAVWEVFCRSANNNFIREMYPRLVAYHKWWYTNRDHDQNGLCEYGSTDGTRIAAAWESGMDNAVRFDKAVMQQNNANAWSLNQESVDLNAYLYAEKLYLAKLATSLGKAKEATDWIKEATALKQKINQAFYDNAKGYYYDKFVGTPELITIEGPEGWIPLWAGISDKQQAIAVGKIMGNPNKFNTFLPLPTLTADHPQFNPKKGYWRGPVWLDQFYFGMEGLKKYGQQSLANTLTEKLFKNGKGLLADEPIHENYHPMSGEGLNAANFSWSAAHILLLLQSK